MTTHSCHDDVHTAGLNDECERCGELAESPLTQCDADLLLRLTRGELFTELDRRAYARLVALGVPVR